MIRLPLFRRRRPDPPKPAPEPPLTRFVALFNVEDFEAWERGFSRRAPLFARQTVRGTARYGVCRSDNLVAISGACEDIGELLQGIDSHEGRAAMAADGVRAGTYRLVVLDRTLEV